MTQNTEQNVLTRDEQIADHFRSDRNDAAIIHAEDFEEALREAEARGAEEQRRKDAEGSLRPISEAKKDRTPILAKIHDDLFPRIRPERADLKPWNGRWVVVSHPGILEDGFDIGWGVAAPVGHGGLTDDWFLGWKPLEYSANVAALEARVKVLEEALTEAASALEQVKDGERGGYRCRNGKFVELQMSDGERADIIHSDVTTECECALNTARAALTREGGE